jgi:hypothetical protein
LINKIKQASRLSHGVFTMPTMVMMMPHFTQEDAQGKLRRSRDCDESLEGLMGRGEAGGPSAVALGWIVFSHFGVLRCWVRHRNRPGWW